MASAVETYGGEIVESFDAEHPTLVIGNVGEKSDGSLVLHATWEGWSGGVVEETKDRLAESVEFPLAGILAAAIGVSEAFQNLRGNAVAGRRSTGLSLWEPEVRLARWSRLWRTVSLFAQAALADRSRPLRAGIRVGTWSSTLLGPLSC